MTFSHPSFAGIIGIAREDITPPVGIYSRNWGAAKTDVAVGIHRPLFVTALTLQSEKDSEPLVLVSLDLGWWKDINDEYSVRGPLLEKLGLDESRVIINLCHSHAGPSICRDDVHQPGGEFIAPYLEKVRDALITATERALSSAREAVLEWSTGWCGLAQDRDLKDPERDRIVCGYNPEGKADGTVLVGRVTDNNGKTFAVVTNYACHPTTLAWENELISPDWCGAFNETVEQNTGATSLFLQGASGELQPRNCFKGDIEIAEAQGRELAYAVLSTLAGMEPPHTDLEYAGVVESGAPLATWRRVPSEPARGLEASIVAPDLALKELPSVAEIEEQLAACEDRVIAERLVRKKRVRKTLGDGATCPCRNWVWRVGDAIITGSREEAYSQHQVQLRAAFPDNAVIVMNLINGSLGYLAPKELYATDIYQVWQSPFAEGCLEMVTNAVIEHLS